MVHSFLGAKRFYLDLERGSQLLARKGDDLPIASLPHAERLENLGFQEEIKKLESQQVTNFCLQALQSEGKRCWEGHCRAEDQAKRRYPVRFPLGIYMYSGPGAAQQPHPSTVQNIICSVSSKVLKQEEEFKTLEQNILSTHRILCQFSCSETLEHINVSQKEKIVAYTSLVYPCHFIAGFLKDYCQQIHLLLLFIV